MKTGTYIEINLKALENNIKKISEISRKKEILCVVKANAYGHGDIKITKALAKFGIKKLGVARVDEGIKLREQGIDETILILGGAEQNEYEALLNYKLTPVIYNFGMAEQLNNYLNFRNKQIDVHLKFDTGMHRLGIPYEESFLLISQFKNLKNLKIIGIMSHFIDADIKNCTWSKLQIKRFEGILLEWKKNYIQLPNFIHIENTAGFYNFNLDFTNMVRLGIGIYGYGIDKLSPVLRLHSIVKDIKTLKKGETVSYGAWFKAEQNMRVAVIPVGYGDGFMRHNRKGSIVINDEKCPIISVICMDSFMVDVSKLKNINIGDKVTIIGCENPANYWSSISDTIVYEVLTLLNPRIRRIYDDEN